MRYLKQLELKNILFTNYFLKGLVLVRGEILSRR